MKYFIVLASQPHQSIILLQHSSDLGNHQMLYLLNICLSIFCLEQQQQVLAPGPINDTVTGPCRDVIDGVGNVIEKICNMSLWCQHYNFYIFQRLNTTMFVLTTFYMLISLHDPLRLNAEINMEYVECQMSNCQAHLILMVP